MPSAALAAPFSYKSLPSITREREGEKLCDKEGTMHILSLRQQTAICIFIVKANAYALSLIRVYESARKKDELCWDSQLRPSYTVRPTIHLCKKSTFSILEFVKSSADSLAMLQNTYKNVEMHQFSISCMCRYCLIALTSFFSSAQKTPYSEYTE